MLHCEALASDVAVTPITQVGQSLISLRQTEQPPTIDGRLDDGEWTQAARVELATQVYPAENIAATELTEVWLTYSREYLYVAFHAFERHSESIRARLNRRDDVFKDDFVAVYLDTYNDRQRAYAFFFNPLGIQADGLLTDTASKTNSAQMEQDVDLSWDGILESKGKVGKDGYVVEIAIPFRTLRFQSGADKPWGLHLQRWISHKAERDSWARVSLGVSGLLSQMGEIAGLQDLFQGKTLDLIPTVTGAVSGERQPDGRIKNNYLGDPGLSFALALSPNFSFSGAINPDFSQVESDVPQIEVNQRFPLFFPEKRPFFLEGAEIFQFLVPTSSVKLVDTRQIVDPAWGAKLAGKFGRTSIGYLAAVDKAPGLRVSPGEPGYQQGTTFNILRIKQDIFKDSAVGLLITDRRFAGTSNTVAAIDGLIRFKGVNNLTFAGIFTKTRDQELDAPGGAYVVRYFRDGRRFKVLLDDKHVTTDYRAQVGFTERTGIHSDFVNPEYHFRPERSSWLVDFAPYLEGFYARDHTGVVQDAWFDQGAQVVFKRNISISAFNSIDRAGFAGINLPYAFRNVRFDVQAIKQVSANGYVTFGKWPNFDVANPVVGNYLEISLETTFKPNARLQSGFLFLKSNLRDRTSGQRLFNEDIIRNRTVFQFTRNTYVRSIVEYNTQARSIAVSELFAYTPHPNTALYAGYGDLLYNGFDPIAQVRSPGLFRQRRSFFIKLSYNYRYLLNPRAKRKEERAARNSLIRTGNGLGRADGLAPEIED